MNLNKTTNSRPRGSWIHIFRTSRYLMLSQVIRRYLMLSYLMLSPVSRNTLIPHELRSSTALAASFFIGSLIVIIDIKLPEITTFQAPQLWFIILGRVKGHTFAISLKAVNRVTNSLNLERCIEAKYRNGAGLIKSMGDVWPMEIHYIEQSIWLIWDK